MQYNHLINNDFAGQLTQWYSRKKRNLPWRETSNPYLIWVSEIILQQTRVKQGLPYYHRFIHKFPTIETLAKTSEQNVLKMWEGLGYYTRARNMHKCAKKLVQNYGGKFPESYSQLLQLPGIGKYTAAAIASFAYNRDVPTVDGNVMRVITRLFRIKEVLGKNSTFDLIFLKTQELLPKDRSAMFNQAMMELGSVICLPKNPKCIECPVQKHCLGYTKGNPAFFPVKKRKSKVRKRFFNYVILKSGNKTLMQKRDGNDIWKGLYEFLLIESEQSYDPSEILDGIPQELLHEPQITYESKVYRHLLSHQEIVAKFIEIEQASGASLMKKMKLFTDSEIQKLPKSVLIARYLEDRTI